MLWLLDLLNIPVEVQQAFRQVGPGERRFRHQPRGDSNSHESGPEFWRENVL